MLNAAVVGLGWWGKQIVKCLVDSNRIRVTHGVDLAIENLADFGRDYQLILRSSLDEVLQDPEVDAVILVTPHSLHEEQVLASIAAGKQVFCEKPLTLTGAGAERILAACEEAGIVLGIGHERRFEPAMEEVLAMIGNGKLGQILHMEANVSHNLFAHANPENWRVNKKDAPAGAMTALGIHLTDLFISFAGRPLQVRAKTAKVFDQALADDHVSVQIDFLSGATASLTCLSTTPFYGRLSVFGTAGWIEVRENGNVDWGLPSEVVISDSEAKRVTTSHPASNTVAKNLESWAAAVAGEATYRYTPQQLLDNVRILEALVYSAANQSAAVKLNKKD
jgi:predicted dehydrogenase